MGATRIRPMAAADVSAAAGEVLRGGWGDREAFFAWAVEHPSCHPFVADDAGRIVGTGVGTAYGLVGWVGTIFVAPDRRGDGLGRALTETVIDDLAARGCRTLVLIATSLGQPLYERLGFERLAAHLRFEVTGSAETADVPGVRPFTPDDLEAIIALDRVATGEDRSAVLRSLAAPETARVAVRGDGTIGGFVVRGPWGGGALIAPEPDDALRLLEWRRRRTGPDGTLAAGLLDLNSDGRDRLLAAGWTESQGPLRMVRGEPLAWRPSSIWGQLNGALG